MTVPAEGFLKRPFGSVHRTEAWPLQGAPRYVPRPREAGGDLMVAATDAPLGFPPRLCPCEATVVVLHSTQLVAGRG